jgi:quercetin dioxygenase-like cupin family protein
MKLKNMNEENKKTETLNLESLDGVIAAPDHHRVIFEDERVRVVELRVKPGETVPVHTHRWTTINYVVSHSDFLSRDADGNIKLDSRDGQNEIKEGAVFCLPPFPALHSVENVGAHELRGITFELKN